MRSGKSPAVVVFEIGKEERSVNQLEEYFAYFIRHCRTHFIGGGGVAMASPLFCKANDFKAAIKDERNLDPSGGAKGWYGG